MFSWIFYSDNPTLFIIITIYAFIILYRFIMVYGFKKTSYTVYIPAASTWDIWEWFI